jgi:hypothetical protein
MQPNRAVQLTTNRAATRRFFTVEYGFKVVLQKYRAEDGYFDFLASDSANHFLSLLSRTGEIAV